MAVTTTKPAYTVRWKDDENERNLRKLFFAAAAAIPDQMLSNLAQTLVRIALKLLELLRAHRAAYGGRAYAPPTDAAQDVWMTTDSDLVETVEELESEFHTQYVDILRVYMTRSTPPPGPAGKEEVYPSEDDQHAHA